MNTLTALQQVVDANLDLLGIKINQRELWLESGEMVPGSNKENENGLHVLDLEYRLVLAVDEISNRTSGLLILLVWNFIKSLDREGLGQPSFSVDPNDEKNSDVEINFNVRDPMNLVPVQNSPVFINGQPMGFGDGSLNTAETLAGVHVNAG